MREEREARRKREEEPGEETHQQTLGDMLHKKSAWYACILMLKHYHQTTLFSSSHFLFVHVCSPVNSAPASFVSNYTADRSHVQTDTHVILTVAAETLICFLEGKRIVMFDMY